MKRFKLFGIIGVAVIALASCDAMLLAMFPEFDQSSDEYASNSLNIDVTIPGDYNAGTGIEGTIEVVAVPWSYDEFGLFFWRDANGNLDDQFQEVHRHSTGGIAAPGLNGQDVFTIDGLFPSNYAVIIFDDTNLNRRPDNGETAMIARWNPPPEFPWADVEFDLVWVPDEQTSIDSKAMTLVHPTEGGKTFGNLPY